MVQIITRPGEGSAVGAIAESAFDSVSPSEGSEPDGVWTTYYNV